MKTCKLRCRSASVGARAQGPKSIDADEGINHSVVAKLLNTVSCWVEEFRAGPARREPLSLVICPCTKLAVALPSRASPIRSCRLPAMDARKWSSSRPLGLAAVASYSLPVFVIWLCPKEWRLVWLSLLTTPRGPANFRSATGEPQHYGLPQEYAILEAD